MTGHSLIRTNPKGQPFIGTCTKCGTENLAAEQANEHCENVRGISQEDALIEILQATPNTEEAKGER